MASKETYEYSIDRQQKILCMVPTPNFKYLLCLGSLSLFCQVFIATNLVVHVACFDKAHSSSLIQVVESEGCQASAVY